MVVWGGDDDEASVNTGGRYDPVTNTWTATSIIGAPAARFDHTAVWSGSLMIVWGGLDNSGARLDTGGRYDPSTNAWTPTATSGAPTGRAGHTALWTGVFMVVWGGNDGGGSVNTGGRYTLLLDVDEDEDGFGACTGDCDDGNPDIHPGATEVCNGLDDDCNGPADDGIPAPTDRPDLTEGKSGTDSLLSWSAASGATGYDVVKGDIITLLASGGDFTSSTTACLANDLPATTVSDTEVPPAGSGRWHLIRAVNACGGNGSYDEDAGGQQGSRDDEIAASPAACP
jgi:hypothetical protein